MKTNKKTTIFVWVIVILITASSWFYFNQKEITQLVITNFEECAAAGNPVMLGYPRQCRANKIVYVENISDQIFGCTSEQRGVDFCIEIYQPVCATVSVKCATMPCDFEQKTFANSCKACANSLVESYTFGECPVNQ